ncbi:MAG: B12-binding domain-containing radical SAM protein [Deltaproteobacteria bacterium]|nr:B12-binding domain-containing radical SAM protein [Deltaproteobacteria bacterium]
MARLLLFTEPNLHLGQDASLPPSWCNLGTARLAAWCRSRGHAVSLLPFFSTLLDSLALSPEGQRWLLERADAATPTLLGMQAREQSWACKKIADTAHLAFGPALERFIYGPHAAGLSRLLADLLTTASRDASCADHPFLDSAELQAERAAADWIGVSMGRVGDPLVEALIRRLARRWPVVVGGSTTACMSQAERERILDELGARALVVGPGERPLSELLEAGSPPRAVVLEEQRYPEVEDLLPAFDLLDLDRFYFPQRVLPVQLSHGCYWRRCAFCRRDVAGLGCRHLPARSIARQLATLADRFDCCSFSLSDEALAPRQARAFCRALLAESGGTTGLSFFAGARPERGFDEATLELMARAGFKVVFWGIESGSARLLRRMRKGTSPPTAERVLRTAAACGITNLCFFMVGFPGETEDDWQATLGFWERNHASIAYNRINPFVLEQGSRVYAHPEEYGVEPIQTAGSGSRPYRVESGIDHARALELKRELLERVSAGLFRIDCGAFFDPPGLGDGDEKLAFLAAQVLGGARLLDAQAGFDGRSQELIPLNPHAREMLAQLAGREPDQGWLQEASRRHRFLVVKTGARGL